MDPNGYEIYTVTPTDPCGSLILDKADPMGDGQSFEVEHFGPDGISIQYINIGVTDDTQMHCWGAVEGAGNTIPFPDGAARRAALKCRMELRVFP